MQGTPRGHRREHASCYGRGGPSRLLCRGIVLLRASCTNKIGPAGRAARGRKATFDARDTLARALNIAPRVAAMVPSPRHRGSGAALRSTRTIAGLGQPSGAGAGGGAAAGGAGGAAAGATAAPTAASDAAAKRARKDASAPMPPNALPAGGNGAHAAVGDGGDSCAAGPSGRRSSARRRVEGWGRGRGGGERQPAARGARARAAAACARTLWRRDKVVAHLLRAARGAKR